MRTWWSSQYVAPALAALSNEFPEGSVNSRQKSSELKNRFEICFHIDWGYSEAHRYV
jgi:hypothetical protein